MGESFSPAFRDTLARARAIASGRPTGVDHLLLALCDDPDAAGALRAAGASPQALAAILAGYIEGDAPGLFGDTPGDGADLTAALRRASVLAQAGGRGAIGGLDALLAVYSQRESRAAAALIRLGIQRWDIVEATTPGALPKPPPEWTETTPCFVGASPGAARATHSLDTYCVDLTARYRDGTADGLPLVGRDAQIQRMAEVLGRRTKNNPLLVGDPGVGKTAVVEGLAQRIAEGRVPRAIRGARLFALSLSALLAGTRYRGDFEERLTAVVAELAAIPGAILFIDEIHTLIGAGDSAGGLDAANMLKPALASGALRCIGATTFRECRRLEADEAIARRFQKVEVPEPSEAEAVDMLSGVSSLFASHHGVSYAPAAFAAAVRLSVRHVPRRRLPDKAIDAIDEAASAAAMEAEDGVIPVVGVAEIAAAVARIARVPAGEVGGDERMALRGLGDELRRSVFGQDAAIDNLVGAVRLSRAGLTGGDRPLGCYLLAGPSGVGMGETCRQLAKALALPLRRIDMADYAEAHSAHRLVGLSPGFRGGGGGGVLTEWVDDHPHCLVVLRGVDAAHPDVLALLAQAMGSGNILDGDGRSVDLRNVLLVMTSSAGVEECARPGIGFGSRTAPDLAAAACRSLPPDFSGRLDAIVPFAPLSTVAVAQVVDRAIVALAAILAERGVTLVASEQARAWLTCRAYTREQGVRPLDRLLRDAVKRPLADELLFGALVEGGVVRVAMEGDRIALHCDVPS